MAILAGDGVDPIARRALAETTGADTPAPAYVRALAQVALGEAPDVSVMLAAGDAFARTGLALAALARRDAGAYAAALGDILADFESPRPAPVGRRRLPIPSRCSSGWPGREASQPGRRSDILRA